MKKVLGVLFLISLIPFYVFCVGNTDPFAHYIVGHVDSSTAVSVTMLESVLPFDLDSPEVAFNSSPNSLIKGLKVGEYSLISNSRSFSLYVSHTPLEYSGTAAVVDGEETSIDYLLYMVIGTTNSSYLYCRSDSVKGNPKEATNNIVITGSDTRVWPQSQALCKVINRSLYVSLDCGTDSATSSKLDSLKEGDYRSTIYLSLWEN